MIKYFGYWRYFKKNKEILLISIVVSNDIYTQGEKQTNLSIPENQGVKGLEGLADQNYIKKHEYMIPSSNL